MLLVNAHLVGYLMRAAVARVLAIAFFIAALAASANADITIDLSSIDYNPAPAIPGKYFTIWVHVRNPLTAEALKDVRIRLQLHDRGETGDYPFSLEPGTSETQTIDVIPGSQVAFVKYKLMVSPEALNGDYNFIVESYIGEKLSSWRTLTIAVLSRKPQIEVIGSSITSIRAGESADATLTLRNVGNDKAMGLLIGQDEDRTVTTAGTVVERELVVLGTVAYVSEIAPGEEASVRLRIAANPEAELKTYMLPLKIRFKDQNFTDYKDTKYLGLRVEGTAEVDATLSSVEPVALPGMASEVIFDLFNTGIGAARFVVADVDTEIGAVETPRNFIGTLEADDFDTFKTRVVFKRNIQPGNYPIYVTLTYKDQYNEQVSVTKALSLKVYSVAEAEAASQQGSSAWLGMAVLAIIVVGVFALYRKPLIRRLMRGK